VYGGRGFISLDACSLQPASFVTPACAVNQDGCAMQAYYWCVGPEQAFYKQCSPGLRFSDEIQTCDWAANVPCGGEAGPGAPSGGSTPANPAQSSPSVPAGQYTGESLMVIALPVSQPAGIH